MALSRRLILHITYYGILLKAFVYQKAIFYLIFNLFDFQSSTCYCIVRCKFIFNAFINISHYHSLCAGRRNTDYDSARIPFLLFDLCILPYILSKISQADFLLCVSYDYFYCCKIFSLNLYLIFVKEIVIFYLNDKIHSLCGRS